MSKKKKDETFCLKRKFSHFLGYEFLSQIWKIEKKNWEGIFIPILNFFLKKIRNFHSVMNISNKLICLEESKKKKEKDVTNG